MPYIEPQLRNLLDDTKLSHVFPMTKGALTYSITKLMHNYALFHPESYQILSDAADAAIDAAEEFRRVVLAPYEDGKRQTNGAISTLDKVHNQCLCGRQDD